MRDLSRWLEVGPLNPSSALFREDDYWLTEERSLTDRALYHWVVTESANGHHTQSHLEPDRGRVGSRSASRPVPIKALEEAGLVTRSDDVLRDRRPIYMLADPIVGFHHVVTRRALARFEDRDTTAAWRDAHTNSPVDSLRRPPSADNPQPWAQPCSATPRTARSTRSTLSRQATLRRARRS